MEKLLTDRGKRRLPLCLLDAPIQQNWEYPSTNAQAQGCGQLAVISTETRTPYMMLTRGCVALWARPMRMYKTMSSIRPRTQDVVVVVCEVDVRQALVLPQLIEVLMNGCKKPCAIRRTRLSFSTPVMTSSSKLDSNQRPTLSFPGSQV